LLTFAVNIHIVYYAISYGMEIGDQLSNTAEEISNN